MQTEYKNILLYPKGGNTKYLKNKFIAKQCFNLGMKPLPEKFMKN